MVDVDAAELAKLSDVVQMPICADAGSFLREMLAQKASIAGSGPLRVEERAAWIGRAATRSSGKSIARRARSVFITWQR